MNHRSPFYHLFSLLLCLLLCGCAARTPRTPSSTDTPSSPSTSRRPYSQRALDEMERRKQRRESHLEALSRVRSGESLERERRTFSQLTDPPAPSPQPTPDPVPTDPHPTPNPVPTNPQLDDTSLEANIQKVCDAIERRQTEVNLTNVTVDDMNAIFNAVYTLALYIPQYFYLSNHNSYYMNSDTTATIYLSWKYDDVEERMAQIERIAAEACSIIPSNADDYEKALLLHDWLCDHITYEYNDEDQNIYGALVQGRCVCAGYAHAYMYLLNQVGIKAEYLRGNAVTSDGGGPHAWNSVILDGERYYFDVTWDDSDEDNSTNYFWFGVTLAEFSPSHELQDINRNPLVPEPADATACNYYYRNGYVLQNCSDAAVTEQIRRQGGSVINLKCASPDDMEPLLTLLGDSHIFDLIHDAGYLDIQHCQYIYSLSDSCVLLTLSR